MLFLGIPVATWLVGLAGGAAVGVAATGGDEAAGNIRKAVAEAINGALGTELVGDDLTGAGALDAALCRWLSGKTGYELRTLRDKESLKVDLLKAGAGEVSKRSGIALRDITDRQMVKEDLLAAAADQIAARAGIKFRNIADIEAVKADLMGFGAARLGNEAGIYLSDPTSLEAVKADLKTWGKQQAMMQVAGDLSAALNLPDQDGRRLVELLADQGYKIAAQGGAAGTITPKTLLKQANGLLLGYAKQEIDRVEVVSKVAERKRQNKEAQRRFRARHTCKSSPDYVGRREGQQYVPVSVRFAWDGKVKEVRDGAAADGIAPEVPQAQAPAAGGVPPALWESGAGNTIKPQTAATGGQTYPGGVPPAPAKPKGL